MTRAVLAQAAAFVEPAKGTLDHPATFLHPAAFDAWIPLDDLQAQTPAWQAGLAPVEKRGGLVGDTGPEAGAIGLAAGAGISQRATPTTRFGSAGPG